MHNLGVLTNISNQQQTGMKVMNNEYKIKMQMMIT